MRNIFILILMLFCFVSCNNSNNINEKQSVTTVLQNDEDYYSDVVSNSFHYSAKFNNKVCIADVVCINHKNDYKYSDGNIDVIYDGKTVEINIYNKDGKNIYNKIYRSSSAELRTVKDKKLGSYLIQIYISDCNYIDITCGNDNINSVIFM